MILLKPHVSINIKYCTVLSLLNKTCMMVIVYSQTSKASLKKNYNFELGKLRIIIMIAFNLSLRMKCVNEGYLSQTL